MRKVRHERAGGGFTLIEVAVTIVIVGIGMLLVLEGLNKAKMAAAQTRNLKLSRELALLTLGQIASGQFQEDVQKGLQGSYAEEGYPDFQYDVVVGDDAFTDAQEDSTFDSWKKPATQATQDKDDEKRTKDPKDIEDQPFEKVKIKVTFPKMLIGKDELKHELVLEQWIPWKQVYGEKDEDTKKSGSSSSSSSSGEKGP